MNGVGLSLSREHCSACTWPVQSRLTCRFSVGHWQHLTAAAWKHIRPSVASRCGPAAELLNCALCRKGTKLGILVRFYESNEQRFGGGGTL